MSTDTLTARTTGGRDATTSPRWRLRALAIGAAVILDGVIVIVARIATGAYPTANSAGGGEMTIGLAMAIPTTLLAGLIAWGLLALLERRTDRAAALWTAIALGVLVLSLLGPLGGVDTASKLTLALLHLAPAATIIPLMRRSASVGG